MNVMRYTIEAWPAQKGPLCPFRSFQALFCRSGDHREGGAHGSGGPVDGLGPRPGRGHRGFLAKSSGFGGSAPSCQTAPAVFYQYLIKPLGKSCRARAL